jgi:DNA-binding response OmpR family regulator
MRTLCNPIFAMKKTLLLVTQDPWLKESVRSALPEEHFQFLLAPDAAEALRHAAAGSFDVVLLDLDSNAAGAWHAAEQILARDPFAPVMLLAWPSGQVELAAAVRAGLVLEKPVNAVRLLQALTTLLSQPKHDRLRHNAREHNFLRYAHPFSPPLATTSAPRHWGLNE